MAVLLVYQPELSQARQDGDDMVLDGVIYGNHVDGDVHALPPVSVRVVGGALMPLAQLVGGVGAALMPLASEVNAAMTSSRRTPPRKIIGGP